VKVTWLPNTPGFVLQEAGTLNPTPVAWINATVAYTNGATTYSHNLLPSSTTKFQMLISAPGTVHFWCIPHQSGGMVGDFHVT